MSEEAEALLHSSKSMNKFLKTCLTMSLIFIIAVLEFAFVNAVIDGLSDVDYLIAMLFDSGSMTFPMLCFGIYTSLPHQAVEIFGSMPFLFMIFFSTTFSPGSGVEGVKELRYLFSRFYFWCMTPGVQGFMEGCPESQSLNMLYLCLSGLLGVVLFLAVMGTLTIVRNAKKAKQSEKMAALMDDDEFIQLQLELYGAKQLRKLQHLDSNGSIGQTNHSDTKYTTTSAYASKKDSASPTTSEAEQFLEVDV
jgi:hypothetical protein